MVEVIVQIPNKWTQQSNDGGSSTDHQHKHFKWVSGVYNPPNIDGRHPFNIITEEVLSE